MSNYYEKPLTDDEFVELGELLAAMPEPYEPMEADVMDGFLTALLCLPEEPSPGIWMPYIFDAEAREGAALANEADQDRLEELIYRRYRTIDSGLARCKKLDPIIYEIEDERGRPVRGPAGVDAIVPFALGFAEVVDRWPGLKEHPSELVSSALLGILRHLPDDIAGDLAEVKAELDEESPIEDLDQALEDVAESVAEIVSVTRGFKPAEAPKPHRPKSGRPCGRPGPHGRGGKTVRRNR